MIFIVTPKLDDFKRTAKMRKIPVEYNFNGLPANPDVRWICSWKNLVGIKITKDDTVILGADYHKFDDEELNKIPIEIKTRSRA